MKPFTQPKNPDTTEEVSNTTIVEKFSPAALMTAMNQEERLALYLALTTGSEITSF